MSALSDADREWLKNSCVASRVPLVVTDPVVNSRAAGLLKGEVPSRKETGPLGRITHVSGE